MPINRRFHRLAIGFLLFALTSAQSPGAVAQEPATVTLAGIRAFVAAQQGRVVVVNFWATWCPPCLREFPDIIEVYSDYHEQGLEVVAVSMNEAEDIADIEDFLEHFEPPFTIYRADSIGTDYYEGVLESWYGEMPMTLIYDRAGQLTHIHKKPLSYEDLATDVEALLR